MAAPALVEVPADHFALIRVLNKMRGAGFLLRLDGGDLIVSPLSRLSEQQRAYLRSHKAGLVALLSDAETLAAALVEAGTAGLWWREGTPPDWSDDRLLAAGEVLYRDGRMVNRHDRRYCPTSAPNAEIGPEYPPAAETPEIASCAAGAGARAAKRRSPARHTADTARSAGAGFVLALRCDPRNAGFPWRCGHDSRPGVRHSLRSAQSSHRRA